MSFALGERPLVLDGGLSTELERRGHDISGRLWSARLLNDDPGAVVEVHSAFLTAGAQVLTTASYQATPQGFAQVGFTATEGEALVRRSVALAQRARDTAAGDRTGHGPIWVAGSVGPYGALLAGGSEYTGAYGAADLRLLREFHRPRLEILTSAGVDVLEAETVPSLLEVEALLIELAALEHPAWLSLTTTTDPDGVVRTRRGEPAAEAFAMAAGVAQVVGVGVNCTDPAGLTAAIEVAAKASGKPVIAYPNSGEGWDAGTRSWTSRPEPTSAPESGLRTGSGYGFIRSGFIDSGFSERTIQAWLGAGARMIGGCCRVGPEVISDVARQLTGLRQ